jgi:hypothetical protein
LRQSTVRKAYATPQLTTHGDLRAMTKTTQSTSDSSDNMADEGKTKT